MSNKCEYCHVAETANCHGHKHGCPYSCNKEEGPTYPKPEPPIGSLPIGDMIPLMLILISIYSMFKFKKMVKL